MNEISYYRLRWSDGYTISVEFEAPGEPVSLAAAAYEALCEYRCGTAFCEPANHNSADPSLNRPHRRWYIGAAMHVYNAHAGHWNPANVGAPRRSQTWEWQATPDRGRPADWYDTRPDVRLAEDEQMCRDCAARWLAAIEECVRRQNYWNHALGLACGQIRHACERSDQDAVLRRLIGDSAE